MSDSETFKHLNAKVYKEQAIWMLNAMWPSTKSAKAEEIWKFVQIFSDLDQENHASGCCLDELNMHRVFEKLNSQKTVQEMRSQMKKAGLENFKKFGLLHFLVFYYDQDWKKITNAPQGDNSEQLENAKKLLEAVSKQLEECQKKAEAAKKSAEEADKRQKEAQKAEDEVTKALDEVKSQEDAKNKKREQLQKKIETAGLVAKNAAIQELAKLDNEDDLPMRRAKTTLEAAQRKAAKAVKIATEAKEKADSDAAEADKAVEETQKKVEEAEKFLKEQQESAGGNGQGTMWWMQRELDEKKKYMPMRKGGVAK
ncbi:hypothetical protein EIN_523450 [Entamoeba invadens IP1]|uniref:Calcium-regulated actin-bundling protein C-terminal domain-containing protein n=2 Tax=Entamoeba invadens TaxID=33085 RepID=A0A0A1UB80_ENTIV|nr:hypothetical protein EIN_523450 [Entamoeba invadens IP1]ELP92457.1 hypothetical protein EIN_523450 [Entamoeba invadens IP1]BAN40645.1 hypothetical protein, conserved [Entamoeba invadens]BAN40787.1 hypothetical protein, conserved [Entamoeba invadens]|eukprot:XP_004259228.1 hypothetical protein EIN_523450 [Entamoeba invadens IP1]